jgi:hypothetical protein
MAAQCNAAHAEYRAKKTASYIAYFAAHPELKAANHAYSARDLASALPDGWGELAEYLPASERHRYHLSGNSSRCSRSDC